MATWGKEISDRRAEEIYRAVRAHGHVLTQPISEDAKKLLARDLGISPLTMSTYLTELRQRLGVQAGRGGPQGNRRSYMGGETRLQVVKRLLQEQELDLAYAVPRRLLLDLAKEADCSIATVVNALKQERKRLGLTGSRCNKKDPRARKPKPPPKGPGRPRVPAWLREADLSILTPEERYAVTSYYELNGTPRKVLRELAEEWGMVREGARQRVVRALKIVQRGSRERAHYRWKYPLLHDRDWILRELVEKNRTLEEVAAEIGCHPSSVSNALTRYLDTPRKRGPKGPKGPEQTVQEEPIGQVVRRKRRELPPEAFQEWLLDQPVEYLGPWTVRARNCLGRAGIETVRQLTGKTIDELLVVRGLGQTTLDLILDRLEREGLDLADPRDTS